MNTVILYGRVNCCLCEEVKSLLDVLKTDYSINLKEVDIDQDEELMEKYMYEIPVVKINGEELDYLSITYIELRERLH